MPLARLVIPREFLGQVRSLTRVYPPKLQIPQDKQIRNSDFRNLLSACMSTGATSHLSEGLGVEAAEVRDEKQKTGGSFQSVMVKAMEDALGTPFGRGPQAPLPHPLVLVISGPSGVGKDAVIKRLRERRKDLHFVVTATSRPMRPMEVEGVDYFFVTKEEFEEMIKNNELLEHALVYGDYKGVPKKQVREAMSRGTDVVLRLDVQGAATVRSMLGQSAVFIFIVAESEVSLVKRLVKRKTETLEKALVRIQTARQEIGRMDEFDYVVVNADGKLEQTVDDICSIINAEKLKSVPRITNF